MDPNVLTSLIAAGSGTGGILLKMGYDGAVERIRSRKEKAGLFLEERKAAYVNFLDLNKARLAYRRQLQELSLIARAGKRVKSEVLEEFPDSPMQDLVGSLDGLRRIARTNDIVTIAERVVSLHGDASAAMRFYMTSEELTYGLPLFLIDRFCEDCEREFVAAYRRDLGIGAPKGAQKDFPVVQRALPMSIADAQILLRAFVSASGGEPEAAGVVWPEVGTGKPLTAKDSRLLKTPKYRAMLTDENES
ncbi:hypothetical protein [Thermomonospora umbrina]|uniref:hypothetical protein n=1 Tax=Thermomonospora umbrina TaxID=111806 RepID=UPI0011C13089|nr:hypothetical protein [Thermomonospora umbrina]